MGSGGSRDCSRIVPIGGDVPHLNTLFTYGISCCHALDSK